MRSGSSSPLKGLNTELVVIIMSLESLEPLAVYRRAIRTPEASGARVMPSFTRKEIGAMGWLRRLAPTPGVSCNTGMPNSSSWSLGPMPESMRMWGDFNAPAESTTLLLSTANTSPPLSTSTPVT